MDHADSHRFRLWFPLLAAPAVWAAQGLLGWFLSSEACPDDPSYAARLSPDAARSIIAAITVVACAVTLVSAGIGWRTWHLMSLAEGDGPRERAEYMSVLGVALSVVLTIALVWAGLPTLLSRGCGAAR